MADTAAVLNWIADNPGSTDVDISVNTGCSLQFLDVLTNAHEIYAFKMSSGKWGYYVSGVGLDRMEGYRS